MEAISTRNQSQKLENSSGWVVLFSKPTVKSIGRMARPKRAEEKRTGNHNGGQGILWWVSCQKGFWVALKIQGKERHY